MVLPEEECWFRAACMATIRFRRHCVSELELAKLARVRMVICEVLNVVTNSDIKLVPS